MWIQLAFGVLSVAAAASVSEASTCSQDELPATEAACIDGLKNSIVDSAAYWFGTSFREECPLEGQMTIECYDSMGDLVGSSVQDLTNISASAIDRTLHVTYVSKPGSYVGCDYHFEQAAEKRLPIDPLSSASAVSTWDARAMPELAWAADDGKQYTLVVLDVARNILHGLYINIQGSDMTTATMVKEYHGPMNPSPNNNLYVFLLYEQEMNDTTLPTEVTDELMGSGGVGWSRPRFKIGNLTAMAQLTGPVAISNVLASYDRFSLARMGQMGIISNCVPYVLEAYRQQNHSARPFLPAEPELSVFLRIQMHNEDLRFTYCCENTRYEERTFFLDPVGRPLVLAGETRTSNAVTVMAQMNKMFPNATADFKDKHYTLLMVDPDVPFATVGTNERPLLHWIAVNNMVDGDGMLVVGKQLEEYRGPMPPDAAPHTYYYMLYEQEGGAIDINSTLDYTHPNCSERSRTRCLFDVNALVAENQLTLVGVSWMVAENDDFVNYSRGTEQEEACGAAYQDPCPATSPSSAPCTASTSVALWLLTSVMFASAPCLLR